MGAPSGKEPTWASRGFSLAQFSLYISSMDARMQRQKRVRQDWAGEELGSEASGSSFSGGAAGDTYSSDDDSGEEAGGRGRVGL